MASIIAFGGYVPRRRLQREAAVAALSWFNAGLSAHARGERAIAGWDEDTVTMAVEAARDCLPEDRRSVIRKLILASTSLPYADRQNAGIVKEALNLSDDVGALDVTGSQRAGTSALIAALESAAGGSEVLCLASERRKAKVASEAELTYGDAAAAILVGPGAGLAELVGHHSHTVDFADHFRASDRCLDYEWEGRWVRDEGYAKIMPTAIAEALAKFNVSADAIDRFIMAAPIRGIDKSVAKAAGIGADAVGDNLQDRLGTAGCAQPLILLAHALEKAAPSELLLVASFGQGCDVLLFRVTDAIGARAANMGVSGWLDRRKAEDSYIRHLHFTGALTLDGGMRAEADQRTPPSMLYRHRRSLLSLVGGRCTKTGTIQFPKSDISVAQNERAIGTQEEYPLAERRARIASFTADSLVYTPDPPGCYGLIEFEGGGRMTVDFTDVDPDTLEIGQPMRMMFRLKRHDVERGFKHYFWKAVPDYRAAT
ncbi:3-hydroxy-3-methylglutaryl CoA synthase [Sphingopyxis lindanitolerans]|uniref:3-hydroxy-3-methylglutaryl CoA synthase n=1 Tax=Sphingopyxis lindanitolerans TaxID=2054227 RepID=A0A2S8B3K5_9SPHN|nr:OB-fold domain-containing protein [Sphingopyxis lindanitolerans]PQM26984.1 3-hydroxy-3-methylglutaryl CoA synthase [Sphingopyxis lindanitolerans]